MDLSAILQALDDPTVSLQVVVIAGVGGLVWAVRRIAQSLESTSESLKTIRGMLTTWEQRWTEGAMPRAIPAPPRD